MGIIECIILDKVVLLCKIKTKEVPGFDMINILSLHLTFMLKMNAAFPESSNARTSSNIGSVIGSCHFCPSWQSKWLFGVLLWMLMDIEQFPSSMVLHFFVGEVVDDRWGGIPLSFEIVSCQVSCKDIWTCLVIFLAIFNNGRGWMCLWDCRCLQLVFCFVNISLFCYFQGCMIVLFK